FQATRKRPSRSEDNVFVRDTVALTWSGSAFNGCHCGLVSTINGPPTRIGSPSGLNRNRCAKTRMTVAWLHAGKDGPTHVATMCPSSSMLTDGETWEVKNPSMLGSLTRTPAPFVLPPAPYC